MFTHRNAAILAALIAVLLVAGCGGGHTSATTTTPSIVMSDGVNTSTLDKDRAALVVEQGNLTFLMNLVAIDDNPIGRQLQKSDVGQVVGAVAGDLVTVQSVSINRVYRAAYYFLSLDGQPVADRGTPGHTPLWRLDRPGTYKLEIRIDDDAQPLIHRSIDVVVDAGNFAYVGDTRFELIPKRYNAQYDYWGILNRIANGRRYQAKLGDTIDFSVISYETRSRGGTVDDSYNASITVSGTALVAGGKGTWLADRSDTCAVDAVVTVTDPFRFFTSIWHPSDAEQISFPLRIQVTVNP